MLDAPAALPPDHAARVRALDPAGSFIVQAPAGSGKTELLTRRFLGLLARAERPEEIVAITFTRKAAGEMATRITDHLALGAGPEPPPDDPGAAVWPLARAAVARDAERGWNLADNPARLQVHTFDAFCQFLARRMPFRSGLGAEAAIADPADPLYAEAAARVFGALEDARFGAAAAHLLRHLDNDMGGAAAHVAAMLAKRDRWLRHFGRHLDQEHFLADVEAAVARLVADHLAALAAGWPAALTGVLDVLRWAGANVPDDDPVAALRDLEAPLGADTADLPRWRAVARVLLKQDGGPRASCSSAPGFPADKAFAKGPELAAAKEMKARMNAVLDDLPAAPAAWREALARAPELPEPVLAEGQRHALAELGAALLWATLHLDEVFAEAGRGDYIQVAQGALKALEDAVGPTELALALDGRIRHLLVDEFQDTSHGQYRLLEQLTEGWEPGDGRTLFLVGDPMQSIYGFREAEVGLYLRARRAGIGPVTLEPVELTANFRATPRVVDHVNRAFGAVFPPVEDIGTGQVVYSPCVAARDEGGPEPTFHPFAGRDDGAEARAVADRVAEALAADPDGSVAVLVRARTHLTRIIPALRAADIDFQAVEIDPLQARPVIVDLLGLTRALLNPADRVAWLAVLRAPWCGLAVADLAVLAEGTGGRGIPDLLADPARLEALGPDARARAEHTRDVLLAALAQGRDAPLHRRVEAAWVRLGGPACVEAPELAHAERYLALLADLEADGAPPALEWLETRVQQLNAEPTGGARVEVMTIHKAKGLAWDTVIVPGLGRRPRGDDRPLLAWLERPRAGREGESDLLIAPVGERGGPPDRLYEHIRRLLKAKRDNEDLRLLYVAATRARVRLHLLGHAERRGGGLEPASGSLLAHLWPVVADDFAALAGAPAPEPTEAPALPLRRLPAGLRLPEPAPAVGAPAPVPEEREAPEYLWAGEEARAVGTVVHRALQRIAEEGVEAWPPDRIARHRAELTAALGAEGMAPDAARAAAAHVEDALHRTLADRLGRWLLEAHPEARSELDLTGMLDGRVERGVIDRTFVADGVRWIVDYKSGAHLGGDLERFLSEERRRYLPQLERYARLMRGLDGRPVRLALYFPRLGQMRDWAWGGEGAARAEG